MKNPFYMFCLLGQKDQLKIRKAKKGKEGNQEIENIYLEGRLSELT